MYFVYILQSIQSSRYYIGQCEDIPVRLQKHNAGKVQSTKLGRPWKVVHCEEFRTRQEAYRRERQIKSFKGGRAFKNLLTATASGGVPLEAA